MRWVPSTWTGRRLNRADVVPHARAAVVGIDTQVHVAMNSCLGVLCRRDREIYKICST
jgi:hypothetical protein